MSAPAIPGWLAALYPFSPRSFAAQAGARLSYLDEGPRGSEAVLLLHGNPTWSFYYRDLVRDLSGALRCIAPDHIGMGLSDKPQRYDYRLSSRIADIEALVGALGLKRVHLVVHDWGGAIGFGWAVRHPELVGRIAIMNTAAFSSSHIPLRISLCRSRVLGRFLVRRLNGFAWPATRMAMHARRMSAPVKRGYLFPYDSSAHRVGVYRFVRDIPMELDHPSRGTLEGISGRLSELAGAPKTIVWGGQDFCFNDSFLDSWRRIYPNAPVRRLPETGHYVLEDGGEEARTLISDFLLGRQAATSGDRLEQRLRETGLRLNQGQTPRASDIRPIA